MDIRWVTAFVDMPRDRFDVGSRFWELASGTTRSESRGAVGEFATLVPESGDAHLRIQRVPHPDPRIHLDLHVDDVPAATAQAVELGAVLAEEFGGWTVLASPGGLIFCFVQDHGPSVVPDPLPEPAAHRIDQISIDIPDAWWDDECAFWQALTGWELATGALAEFAVLVRPAGLPMRVILQRLGPDDEGTAVRAHLDVACGPHRDAIEKHHVALGAVHLYRGRYWTTLRDPAGLPYCLTERDPVAGSLPG